MSNKRRRVRVKATPVEFKRVEGTEMFELIAKEEIHLHEGLPKEIKSGIHIEIPVRHIGLISTEATKSKTGLTLSKGVEIINSGDKSEVKLTFISHRGARTIFEGDVIANMVIIPLTPVDPQFVKNMQGSEESE